MFDGADLADLLGLRDLPRPGLILDPADPINAGRRCWPMFEEGGLFAEELSASASHATFAAAAARETAPWGAAPRFVRTAGNYALAPQIPAFASCSVAFWFTADATAGVPVTSNTQPFCLDDATERLVFTWDHNNAAYQQGWGTFGGGSYPVAKYSGTLAAGRPYLIGATLDGSTLVIYLDGVAVGSVATGIDSASGLVALGGRPASPWGGVAGMFSVWTDRLLSPADWLRIAAEPLAGLVSEEDRLYSAAPPSAAAAYTLPLAAGTFAVTGQAVALRAARRLALANGTLAFTGQAVALKMGRRLALAQGALALTGQSVRLLRGSRLVLAAGSVALAGQSLRLLAGRRLPLAAGAIALAGQGVTLTYTTLSRTLALSAGVFTASGQDVRLLAGRRLPLAAGSAALAGQAVGLLRGRRLSLAGATFTLSGQSLRLLRGFLLSGGTGTFVLSGQALSLVWSGAVVPLVPAARTVRLPARARIASLALRDRGLALPGRNRIATLPPERT